MEATAGSSALRDPDRVAAWLASGDGTAAVATVLRRFRLPQSFDTDLVGMVLHAADLMDARGEQIDVIEAWARRTLRLRAMDLARSPRAADRTTATDTGHLETVAAVPDGVEGLVAAMALATVRRSLHRRLASPGAWAVSAAFTYLTVAVDGGTPGAGCPRPRAGADELDAAHWAGLHYAGAGDCFAAGGDADSPALRQRRKRRIDQVRAALIESYGAAGAGDA